MSILDFLLKSNEDMARKDTRIVRVGKYTLTKHAQNRIVDKNRKTAKWDVVDNLYRRPNGITAIKYDNGRPSYNRVGRRITTSINPTNNYITSCRPVSRQEIKQFNLVNVGKKGAKKKYVKSK